MSLLNGTFYAHLDRDFHEAWTGNQYVYLIDRRPNVPSGTNELRTQMHRHAAFLFGNFPQIETADPDARNVLTAWAQESELEERMRHAVYIGSSGSVALHVRALSRPGGRARVFLDVYSTEFLTPEFDPFEPDVLVRVTERYKIRGADALALGYPVAEDQTREWFWFQRIFDQDAETWFLPWPVAAENEARSQGRPFAPVVDDDRTVIHGLGFCPWIWTRTPGADPGDVDGPCAFEAGIEHAIQLDYQDSQIVAGIKYAMSPTMVLKTPLTNPGVTASTDTGAGLVKSPDVILKIDAEADAKYLEMDGAGFEQARQKSKELRSNLIEFVNGDRVDPKEITQGHQGSKTMAMINAPMLNYIHVLQKVYGQSVRRVLVMVAQIAARRPVLVSGELASLNPPTLKDLSLRWDDFYELTSTEKFQDASAIDIALKNGTLSRETAVNDIAKTYGIQDVSAELKRIEGDHKADDTRAMALAQAQAQVKVNDTID